jgi:hypothetical protein
MFRRRLFILVLFTCIPANALANHQELGLRVSIDSHQAVYFIEDPILIKLTVENTSEQNRIVYPSFSPVLETIWPSNVLSFQVVSKQGHHIPKTSNSISLESLALVQPVQACDFRELSPGSFFGSRFDLNGVFYHYKFVVGEFNIRAIVKFRANEWLEAKTGDIGERFEIAKELAGVRHLLASGVAVSNDLRILVVSRKSLQELLNRALRLAEGIRSFVHTCCPFSSFADAQR